MNRGSRGQSPARGRGRGNGRGGRGRGRGRGRGGSQVIESEMFYDTYGSGSSTPRKWGTKPKRGLGSPSGPVDFGYGRGAGFRGRGRGNTLTSEDRPLLRPITFVPSTAPILFQEEEEILKPIVEEVDDKEESHVPTANTVLRVFSHRPARIVDSDFNNTDAEEIEEVDFHDLSAFQEKVHKEIASTKDAEVPHEEKFTGIFVAQATREVIMSEPAPIDPPTEAIEAHEDTPPPNPPESSPGEGQAMVTETLVPEAAAIALPPQEVTREEIASGNNAEESHEEKSTGIFEQQEAREVVMSEPAPVDPHPTQTNDEVVDASPPNPRVSSPREVEAMVTEPTVPETAVLPPPSPTPETAEDDSEPSFFFDSTPAPISLSQPSRINTRPLGVADDDDVIVYEAPLPRSRASTPAQHNFPSTFTFTPSPTKLARLPHPGRSAVKNKLLDRRRKRKATATSSFADRAAAVAEAQLYGDDKRDGRYDERRRDDSDVEWGDSDGEGVIDNDGAEGMDVDPELELDSEAMKRFAKGLGGPWKTMDDIADEERMKLEDEEDENDSGSSSSTGDDSDDEEDALRAIEQEENEMMGDSDEEIYSPDTSFQMRLEALRLGSKAGKSKAEDEDSDGDDDDEFELNRSWADQDDDFIAHIQDVVDRDGGEDRQLKRIFQAMQNGTFNESDEEWTKPARRKKDKWKDLPPSLQSQWESDRKKKADRKRERELEKLIQAADPMEKKKGGKKGRNAMLAVAGLDPTIQVIPNRIIDPTTLVQQIKRFIANIGGPLTMSLPPTNKQTRKHVHELAMAFGLKSVSKGKGDSRYTTLTKSSRTGQGVDERKVSKVMRIMGARGGSGGEWGDWAGSKGGKSSGGGGGGGRMPHHKEGEEVGKAAPKIGQANIGFRMLASMGWAEGTHIGVAEDRALKDPLTAVIKNTKLGLGATK